MRFCDVGESQMNMMMLLLLLKPQVDGFTLNEASWQALEEHLGLLCSEEDVEGCRGVEERGGTERGDRE